MSGTGRKSRIHPLVAGFLAGMAIALVVGLMATINLQYGAPWAANHTLTAQVSDADSIAIGSDVRIAGRLVGQVVSATPHGDRTDVIFHVDGEDWPLASDTTAAVRLATLLGQKYIQLNPGHATQMLADNSTIGLGSTKPVVDFDQILNTFDQPTRHALASLLRTVSAAVTSQEGTIQQLAPTLSDISVHSQTPTGELAFRDPQLNQIFINLGITASALNLARDDFAGNIDNLNAVTAALSRANGAALKGYIVNTDALNLTTHTVLGGGYAAKLDNGLIQLPTFAAQLNTLLVRLIPQTSSFLGVPPGVVAAADCRGAPIVNPCSPAQASINLVYEIGSATSQSDAPPGAPGNFFLRQNPQGVDPCGLLPCNGVSLPQPGSGPPSLPGLPTLPSPPNIPLPVCIPLLQQCSTTLPAPSLNLPTLPTVPALPTLPSIQAPNLPVLPLPTNFGGLLSYDPGATQSPWSDMFAEGYR